MFMARSSEVIGEEPGLASVDTAIATPWRRKASTGGACVSRSMWKAPGSSTATVPARPIAAASASLAYSTWSADKAPNSAASAAPPMRDNCSAWSLSGSPARRAASKTRRVSSTEKAMPSQKASTMSARPSLAAAGSILSQTRST